MTRKIILVITAIAFLLLGIKAVPVFADYADDIQTQLNATAGQEGAQYGEAKDPRLVAAYVIQIFLGTLGTLFVVYFFYGGFLIMISGGQEEKTNKGKKILQYAVLGAVISMSAFAITLSLERYLRLGTHPNVPDEAFYAGVGIEVSDDKSNFYNNDPLGEDAGITNWLDDTSIQTW